MKTGVENRLFIPVNIVDDFGLSSQNAHTKSLAKVFFETLSCRAVLETETLLSEWEVLFCSSENSRRQGEDIKKRRAALGKIMDVPVDTGEKERKALFALQTVYALVVKLIARKAVSEIISIPGIPCFSESSDIASGDLRLFFERLESGYPFAAAGIKNLFGHDFFSWYCAENQWDGGARVPALGIAGAIGRYADSSFQSGDGAIDIFKDLYMEIIPAEVRHSLGEYFTPSWLADYVVKKSLGKINKTRWRGIDPCCGSGVFVISMIKRKIGGRDLSALSYDEKRELLNEITGSVCGIDINPLAVLTARVSYLLAVSPLIGHSDVEIPIYLGDSANIPEITEIDGIACFSYMISTPKGDTKVILPCDFVRSRDFTLKMGEIQSLAESRDKDLLLGQFLRYLPVSSRTDGIKKALKDLLIFMHKSDWDGAWVRIVTNYMLVARVDGMDLIVGNPPWVKWEFLPQNYAQRIKALCIDKKLFSGQTYMGAISLNICALIANVTASAWLVRGGILSFLMPKTLMTQDSYAGFRNFYIGGGNRMYLQELDDWSEAGNPFISVQEKFLTYYYRHKPVDYGSGVKINVIKKTGKNKMEDINRYHNFSDAEDNFCVSVGAAYQLDKNRTGFSLFDESTARKERISRIVGVSDYKARSGTEFTPAEVYLIRAAGAGEIRGNYIFENSKFRNSKYKSLFQNEFELEHKYIFPVVKGPRIKRFKAELNNEYCIFPYDYKKYGLDSVPETELNGESPLLRRYLSAQRPLITSQSKRSIMIAKGGDFYALSKIGKYSFAEYLVAFRDNTNMAAAVVTKQMTPWGDAKMPVCAKHAPYISMDKDGSYIGEDEARYICGILNTKIVNEYFKSTFSTRSYSIGLNIKLPKFDPKNKLHRQISKLSGTGNACKSEKETDLICEKIERIYLEICEATAEKDSPPAV